MKFSIYFIMTVSNLDPKLMPKSDPENNFGTTTLRLRLLQDPPSPRGRKIEKSAAYIVTNLVPELQLLQLLAELGEEGLILPSRDQAQQTRTEENNRKEDNSTGENKRTGRRVKEQTITTEQGRIKEQGGE